MTNNSLPPANWETVDFIFPLYGVLCLYEKGNAICTLEPAAEEMLLSSLGWGESMCVLLI